jgi:GLPGLI family protein
MKLQILIACIFTTLNCLSQTVIVNYDVYFNTDRPVIKKGTLYVTNNKQIYIQGANSERKVSAVDENNNIKISSRGYIDYYKIDYQNENLEAKLDIKGTEYMLIEEIPSMPWKIHSDEKNINGVPCRKATLKFRGRSYTAWFSDNFGVTGGPWKFNNVPGLILNIYDDTKRFEWQATTIKDDTISIEKITLPPCAKCSTINIKEYANLRYSDTQNKSLVLRNLPRGATSTYTPGPRNGFEIAFEWEN